jgi:hypothetical protein
MLQVRMPAPGEADTPAKRNKWFEQSFSFSGEEGWASLKGRAREAYETVVDASHEVLLEAQPAMNVVWGAVAGKGRGGEVRADFAITCLELIIAEPGAPAQYPHQDLFSCEWWQFVIYITAARDATVSTVFKYKDTDGSVYEGDAGAVAYLTKLRNATVTTVTCADGSQRQVLTDAEFASLVGEYAQLVAIGLTDSDGNGVERTPFLMGEVPAGTVTMLHRERYHHAPAVATSTRRLQLIGLCNKKGDNRNAKPTEPQQRQSPELAAELGLITAMLDSPAMMKQVATPFFLSLATVAKGSVLPKAAWERLVRAQREAKGAPERVADEAAALRLIRRHHDCSGRLGLPVDVNVSDDDTDEADVERLGTYDVQSPLSKRWREVVPGGKVLVRETRGRNVSRTGQHTWDSADSCKIGSRNGPERDRCFLPPGTISKTWFRSKGTGVFRDYYFNMRCSYEEGVVTQGTAWMEVRVESGPPVVVKLREGTQVRIQYGTVVDWIGTARFYKNYAYFDHLGAVIRVVKKTMPEKEVHVGEDEALLIAVPLCEKCGVCCWERSRTAPADRATHWCFSCVLGAKPTQKAAAATVRHEYGLESTLQPANGVHPCACPECLTLPDGYKRKV